MTAPFFSGPRDPDRAFSAAHRHFEFWSVGDGAKREFVLGDEPDAAGRPQRSKTYRRTEDVKVFVAGIRMRPDVPGTAHDFSIRGLTAGYDGDKNAVRLTVAPALNADICIDVITT